MILLYFFYNGTNRLDYQVKRLLRASISTWNGLVVATKSEQAFREELVLLALAVPLAFFLTSDVNRRFVLVASVVLILIVELLNTAVEKLGDRITLDHDEKIGRIKDMASAAVGVSLLLSGAVWLWTSVEWLLY
jgi:diacylglycerol kinase (ATP)